MKKINLLIILFGFLLTVILTYPLITSSTNYLTPAGDNLFNHWIMHHNYKSVTEHFFLEDKYFNSNEYYPFPSTLTLADNVLFPSFAIYSPLYILTNNSILSFNLTIFMGIFLTFVSTFFCVNYLIKNRLGSMFSALIFSFSPMVLSRFFGGHTEYLHRYFVPLLLIGALVFFEKPTFKRGLFLSVIFFLSWITNLQMTIFSSVFILALFLYFLVIKSRGRGLKPWFLSILKYLLFFMPYVLAIIVYLYLPYWQTSLKENYTRTIEDTANYSPKIRDFFLPNQQSELQQKILKDLFHYKQPSGGDTLTTGTLSWVMFFLALFFFRKKNKDRNKHTPLFTGLFFLGLILAAGPFLNFNGLKINLPYFYLYDWFFLMKAIRTPARIMLVTYFFYAAIIGFFIKKILSDKSSIKKTLIILLFLFFVVEYRAVIHESPSFREDFVDYNLENKRVLFLPFPNRKNYERNAYYLINSIDGKFTMMNQFIGTELEDHLILQTEIKENLLKEKFIKIMKTLDINTVVIDFKEIKNYPDLYKLSNNNQNLITFADKNWEILDIGKAQTGECFSNSTTKTSLDINPTIDFRAKKETIVNVNFKNISLCHLKYIYSDRYLPIRYQVVYPDGRVSDVSNYNLQLFPYLLKGESIDRHLELPLVLQTGDKLKIEIKRRQYILE